MRPLVSVVLGVRDAARSLVPTAASVLAQRGVPLELVLVDDGSNDGTPRIAARLARGDARVRVFRQAPAGLTRALMLGCAEARGALIARIDAGDRMLPGRLARQAGVLERHPELALLGTLTALHGPRGEPLAHDAVARPGALADLTAAFVGARVAGLQGLAHPSVCFRSGTYRAAGGYRPAFALAQDVDLWARMSRHGGVARLEEVLTHVRVGLDGLSPRHHRAQTALRGIAARCARVRRRGGDESLELARAAAMSRAALARARADGTGAYFVACCLARRGDLAAAAAYYRIAVRRDPAHVRARIGLARVRTRRALALAGALPTAARWRPS